MEKLILAYLGKTLNLAPEQLAEMLYKKTEDGTTSTDISDSALETLLQSDASRVAKLREGADSSAKFDDGYKKGQKESLSKFEKSLREKFTVGDETLQGVALVDAIVGNVAKMQLDEDKVKMHPVFLSLEAKKNAELEATRAEAAAKITEIETAQKRKETLSVITEKARAVFAALNPVLPTNAEIAQTQTSLLLETLNNYDYDTQNGVVVLKDGKRVEDAHGNPKTLEQIVKEEASRRFEFRAQDPKGNAGNEGGNGGGKKSAGIKYATKDEVTTALFAAKDSTERALIAAANEALLNS